MSYLLNYKQWRAVFEAAESNYNLSQTGVRDIPAVARGNAIYNISDQCTAWGWLDAADNNTLLETLSQTIGYAGMPELFVNAGDWNDVPYWSNSGDPKSMMDVFKFMIAGIGKFHGIENFGDQLVEGVDSTDAQSAVKRVGDMSLKVTMDKQTPLYLGGLEPGATAKNAKVSSSHRIENWGTVLNPDKKNIPTNNVRYVCSYINTFNLINFANGDCTQYVDIDECVDSNGVLQLGNEAKGVKKSETAVYLFSPYTLETKGSSLVSVTTTTQGKEGLNDSVTLTFKTGEWATDDTGLAINATHPTVQQKGAAIVNALGEKDTIKTMKFVSSASRIWGGVTQPISNGSGAPAGVTEQNYKSSGEKGNQWLAWKRGQQFAQALAEFLGPQILKPEAITVDWKVSNEGEGGGKNIMYSVTGTGVAPEVRVDNQYVQAVRKRGGNNLTMYRYKFDWNTSALTEQTATWMKKLTFGLIGGDNIGFSDLMAGDEVVVKTPLLARDGRPTGDFKEVNRIVSKVEGDGRNTRVYIFNADKTKENELTVGSGNAQYVKTKTKASGKGTVGV